MLEQTLTFVVKGPPVPKGRPRMAKSGVVYTPKRTRDYEHIVRTGAIAALAKWKRDTGSTWIGTGSFALIVTFGMHDKRPRDLDNLIKSVSDGIQGVLFNDDRQIDYLEAQRRLRKDNPCAVVTVSRLGYDSPHESE